MTTFKIHACPDNTTLKECSELFSNHYGMWKNGSRIKLSVRKLQQEFLFNDKTCKLYTAHVGDNLIGQAFACHFNTCYGRIDWITQLVVHSDYRKQGIGKKLCKLAFDIDTAFACCVVSANIATVRLLECATGRKVDRERSVEYFSEIANASGIPYMENAKLNDEFCQVDTSFPIDVGVSELLDNHEHWACVFGGMRQKMYALVEIQCSPFAPNYNVNVPIGVFSSQAKACDVKEKLESHFKESVLYEERKHYVKAIDVDVLIVDFLNQRLPS